jgi:hypothetical protein
VISVVEMDYKKRLDVILYDIVPIITYGGVKVSTIFVMTLESRAYWLATQINAPIEKYLEISDLFRNIGIETEQRMEAIEKLNKVAIVKIETGT